MKEGDKVRLLAYDSNSIQSSYNIYHECNNTMFDSLWKQGFAFTNERTDGDNS